MQMINMLVLDVSAAAAVVHQGIGGALFAQLDEGRSLVVAPSLFRVEASQVAWKFAHSKLINTHDSRDLARAMIGLIDDFTPDEELIAEALAEATRMDHSVYDMLYCVLARRSAAPLFTGDRKLAKVCDRMGIDTMGLVEL